MNNWEHIIIRKPANVKKTKKTFDSEICEDTLNRTLALPKHTPPPPQPGTTVPQILMFLSAYFSSDASVGSSNKLEKIDKWWPPARVELLDRLEEAACCGCISNTALIYYCWLETSEAELGCLTEIPSMGLTAVVDKCVPDDMVVRYTQEQWMRRIPWKTPNKAGILAWGRLLTWIRSSLGGTVINMKWM